jgi:hypothetical protein
MSPTLHTLTESIRLAGTLGGEVILTNLQAVTVMNDAGLRAWEELAAATGAEMTFDPAISRFRFRHQSNLTDSHKTI